MNEAMIKVKSELGIDAVILNSRKIKRSGIFGFLKKPLVEVVATVDREYKITEKKTKKKPKLQTKPAQPAKEESKLVKPDNKIDDKLAKLTEVVSNLEKKMSMYEKQKNETVPKEKVTIQDPKKKYIQFLMDKDLNKNSANKIMNLVSKKISINSNNNEAILNTMRLSIKEYIGRPKVIKNSNTEQRVFLFVGPTGVGKTTTLAKLAAKLSLQNNKKVGLITADTYRIAAVEQLKVYSEILGVNLEVIYEPNEIQDALDAFSDKDYILIDTAGRSHKSKELRQDIEGMINYIESPEIFLVLSLVADYKNLINIIKSYDFVGKYRIIFTKLDEAVTFANILNIKDRFDAELSYITNGQSVPDDIEVLDSDKLANVIIGDRL